MNCCINCFISDYLTDIINADDRKGNCNFCNSTDVSIYSARELSRFFFNMISIYEVDENSKTNIGEAFKIDYVNTLSEQVVNCTQLLSTIISDDLEEFKDLFQKNVSTSLSKKAVLLQSVWNNFKDEIKFTNRYHIKNTIDLNILELFFKNETFYKEIKKGKIFYRCRISDENGFQCKDMANPPKELASSGRANPKGISYLYVADSVETSLYETRASLFDFATVAEFKLKEDLKILNLRNPKNEPIVWSENEEIENYLIYFPFIQTLQKELGLPIRKKDKVLDYIPTQYISEFIKSIGFDGVEYQSSLNPTGFNIAIFHPEKLQCIQTSIFEINNIKLEFNKLQPL